MEKKKLGLSDKSKLELSKTVGSGTVKQSFSHGRVKSVAVEVKKIRTFRKNNDDVVPTNQDSPSEDKTKLSPFDENKLEENTSHPSNSDSDETNKDRLRKLKESAQTDRIARENKISSTEKANKKEQIDERTPNLFKNKEGDKKDDLKSGAAAVVKKINQEKSDEAGKKTGNKKNRADLKKQLSLGKVNIRRQTGKITIQQAYNDEERQRSLASIRRAREKEKKAAEGRVNVESTGSKPIVREVKLPEYITVQELANRMASRVGDVIKVLIANDITATANQTIDSDTAELVVLEFGHKPKRVSESDIEVGLGTAVEENADAIERPAIVTVMGHVDHGKTTLLDALRNTDVVSKEHGGITQHIGSYQVKTKEDKKITFIDTPGHSAFSGMRARGAKLTDIVVLVVAADDGVMPQTIEAIQHSKAANVPIIVAVNKIDAPGADKDKITNELLKHDIVVEKLGGEVPLVEISALKKQNLDSLLDTILLVSEILEIKASLTQRAEGTVVESKREQGRGVIASIIQQRGILRKGDIVVAGSQWGKIRAIIDDKGKNTDELYPSAPAEILGLNDVPLAGDDIITVENEARAREVSEYRNAIILKEKTTLSRANSMEDILKNIKSGEKKLLNLILKADALGSKEAIINTLEKIGNDEVNVQILLSGVGGINETDVSLAATNEAMIIGFNVRADIQAKKAAKQQGINVKYYSVIYEIFDEIRDLLSGLLAPTEKEKFLGYATIKQVFKITKVGKIAGCLVTEGIIKKNTKLRILRDNVVIHSGELDKLKRHNDETKEVKQGLECGVSVQNFSDIQVDDVIECYEIEKTARKLEEKV
ncbi:translation initiation factor IF-2 [Alphaproteobacteria bacterium]|nr:translation initiation factor IF-2 [Alphaproteobacteria bacterium]